MNQIEINFFFIKFVFANFHDMKVLPDFTTRIGVFDFFEVLKQNVIIK